MKSGHLFVLSLALAAASAPGDAARQKEVMVSPGESIQNAIDGLKAEGGAVTLRRGTYKVDRSLVIYSNITLQGARYYKPGDAVITSSTPGMSTPILTNNGKPIVNVTVRNLTIRGDLETHEQLLPPEYHKNPQGKPRKSYLGILFTAGGASYEEAENRNIRMEKLQVSNCSMGIHIKGARDVQLVELDLHNNGLIKKYYHNIYLRRVFKVTIKDSAFYDSPSGCGINISQSGDVKILKSLARDNFWRGMRIYGEHKWIVEKIEVADNKCLNNGDYGFMLCNIRNGTASGNTAKGNKAGNLKSGNVRGVAFADNDW